MNFKLLTNLSEVNSLANNPYIGVELSKDEVNRLLTELNIPSEDVQKEIRDGYRGKYAYYKGISFTVSDSGEINGLRVFRPCKFDNLGDEVEIEITYHKVGESYGSGTYRKEGFETKAFNTMAGDRRRKHRQEIDEKADILSAILSRSNGKTADMIISALVGNTITEPISTETKSVDNLDDLE